MEPEDLKRLARACAASVLAGAGWLRILLIGRAETCDTVFLSARDVFPVKLVQRLDVQWFIYGRAGRGGPQTALRQLGGPDLEWAWTGSQDSLMSVEVPVDETIPKVG